MSNDNTKLVAYDVMVGKPWLGSLIFSGMVFLLSVLVSRSSYSEDGYPDTAFLYYFLLVFSVLLTVLPGYFFRALGWSYYFRMGAARSGKRFVVFNLVYLAVLVFMYSSSPNSGYSILLIVFVSFLNLVAVVASLGWFLSVKSKYDKWFSQRPVVEVNDGNGWFVVGRNE